jgi:hypothetical protein
MMAGGSTIFYLVHCIDESFDAFCVCVLLSLYLLVLLLRVYRCFSKSVGFGLLIFVGAFIETLFGKKWRIVDKLA